MTIATTPSRRSILAGAAASPVLALPAVFVSAGGDRFASLTMRWREATKAAGVIIDGWASEE